MNCRWHRPKGCCHAHSTSRKTSRRHLHLQLDVEEQHLHSELLQGDGAPHSVPKCASSHTTEENSFLHQSWPKVMTTDERWNKLQIHLKTRELHLVLLTFHHQDRFVRLRQWRCRRDPPVSLRHHLSLTLEQDPLSPWNLLHQSSSNNSRTSWIRPTTCLTRRLAKVLEENAHWGWLECAAQMQLLQHFILLAPLVCLGLSKKKKKKQASMCINPCIWGVCLQLLSL